MKRAPILFVVWLLTGFCYAQSVLHVNEAFVLQVTPLGESKIRLSWKIAEGYFLYQDGLHIESLTSQVSVGPFQFPKGESLEDKTSVYHRQLIIDLPLIRQDNKISQVELSVSFIGCPPNINLCYPPQHRKVTVSLPPLENLPVPIASSPIHQPSSFLSDDFLSQEEILDPELALMFSVKLEGTSTLVAHWDIAQGYYLYKAPLKFVLQEGQLGPPQFPQAQLTEDLKLGQVEVYYDELTVQLPIEDARGLSTLSLVTTYQGCAEDRICYPPMEKTSLIALPVIEAKNQQNIEKPVLKAVEKTNPIVLPVEAKNQKALDEPDNFLKPEEAFMFSAEWLDPSHLSLRWQISKGYYLYREKFKFFLRGGGNLGIPQFPVGSARQDPLFGKVEIFSQPTLDIAIPLHTPESNQVTLEVEYQGCAFAGLCYPPVKKTLQLSLGQFSEQDRIAHLLADANTLSLLAIFFGLGLLLSLTPCVYPMLPILNSCIVGQGKHLTTFGAFLMSMAYVLAMAVTYAVVGALTGLLGENLQAWFQNFWVLMAFTLLFVMLSLSMFGFYELQLPSSWQTQLAQLSYRQQGGHLIGVMIMGILSALIVSPCVAAPLAGALIYIGQTGDAWFGGVALFMLALGMGVPLVITGTLMGHFLPKAGPWMEAVKTVFGVLLLGTAIWMLERVLPDRVTMWLWAILLIVSSVYMDTLEPLSVGTPGWRKLWKGLGIIVMVYGILLMIGAIKGNGNIFNPLEEKTPIGSSSSKLAFKPIKGLAELEYELKQAREQKKIVMLDFYAEWCISCKEMEQLTLSHAEVQKKLAHVVWLQADVTANDEQDQALYKHFGLYGPPAILFFKEGEEQRAHRVIGFMSASEFIQHLERV